MTASAPGRADCPRDRCTGRLEVETTSLDGRHAWWRCNRCSRYIKTVRPQQGEQRSLWDEGAAT